MGRHPHPQEEVAAVAAVEAGPSLAGGSDPRSVAHAGGDLHLDSVRPHHLAPPLTGGTRGLPLTPRPAAGRAQLRALELDRPASALAGLLEGDLHLGLEVVAPRREAHASTTTPTESGRTEVDIGSPPGPAGSAAEIAEEHSEELREVAEIAVAADVHPVAAALRTTPWRARSWETVRVAGPVRPQLVVAPPLLGIREDLVGLVDLLEALGGRSVSRVLVGVVLAGQAPVRLLDRLRVGGLLDAQDLVVVLVRDSHA